MKELIGKKIVSVYINDDDTILAFKTASGNFLEYGVEGDCCSTSWFSNITGLKNLIGEKVTSVVEREEFSDAEQNKAEKEYKKNEGYESESLALYGYMLKTAKGTCDIEFRNSSNGYYGGWCSYIGITSDKGLKEVKEDK